MGRLNTNRCLLATTAPTPTIRVLQVKVSEENHGKEKSPKREAEQLWASLCLNDTLCGGFLSPNCHPHQHKKFFYRSIRNGSSILAV
jgi:hypothetical protein